MGARPKIARSPDVEVIGLLAEGGMSEVYLGRRHGFEDLVVLKRLHPKHDRDPALRAMFEDEARISALVSGHPNIVRFIEEGELDGSRFIAMELVEGLTVCEILNRCSSRARPVPPAVAVRIALDALDALIHAHGVKDEQGHPLALVHRDVTPQNIVVTWDGVVKLLDFGVSKSNVRTHDTAPGLVKGKPYFMAPEQLQVQPLDHRVDLFALGIVLYFLLTLRHPFEGNEDMNVLAAMVSGRVRPPRAVAPDLPESLCQDVLRALATDREDRFCTAEEMKEALLTCAVDAASREDVMVFLSELGAPAQRKGRALAPTLTGDESWHDLRVEDPDARAAVEAISLPYRPPPKPAPAPLEPATAPAVSPPSPPAAPTPAHGEAAPSRGLTLAWAAVWLLAGLLAATWLMRAFEMAPAPALVVTSTPPGAEVFFEGHATDGRTPMEVSDWPAEGPIVVRWTMPDHRDCRAVLTPRAGRTVRAECRMRGKR